MNSDSTPKERSHGFSDSNSLVPWKNLSFEEKIVSILRFNKFDDRILQEIHQNGGPAKLDIAWWQQHIFPLLTTDDASSITELLNKKRAFDSALAASPQFAAEAQDILDAAVQKMFEQDWDNPTMLSLACRISPPGVQAVLRRRISHLVSFLGIPDKVWGIVAIIIVIVLIAIFNR